MKSSLTLLIYLIFSVSIAYAQVEDVVSEVEDSYKYYESAFKKIQVGLEYINECYELTSIEDIHSYISYAEDEFTSAKRYAGYAEDEADDAEDESSNIDCSEAESKADDAKDYFYSASRKITMAINELSNAYYEDDPEYLSDYLYDAKKYINEAITELNYGVDELKNVLSELEDCVVNVQNYSSSDVSCSELYEFIEENGYRRGSLTDYTMNSSWLKKVTAYSYDYKIYVVAEIKENQYSYRTETYIFCGIPDSNWSKFRNGGYYESDSYGERFHKYIFDYKCNCR